MDTASGTGLGSEGKRVFGTQESMEGTNLMITERELNPHGIRLNGQGRKNFLYLYYVLNELRAAWGKPLIVTSGVRSQADQFRIYSEKNRLRVQRGLQPLSIPKASQHLVGAAADLSDPKGLFYDWCIANDELLTELGVYLEDSRYTPGWCHVQVTSPRSGARVFIP